MREQVLGEDSCFFKDVRTLVSDAGPQQIYCAFHDRLCTPKATEGLVAGVSCKGISKANAYKHLRKGSGVLQNESSKGGSADTWHGTLRVVVQHAPAWVILENSDELVNDECVDWTRIVKALRSYGYRCKTLSVDTAEFALPQHRGRAYLVATAVVHSSHSINEFDVFHQSFTDNVCRMRRIPPSVLDILLSHEDPKVQKALDEWQSHEASSLQASTADGHMSMVLNKRRSPLVMSYARLKCRDSTQASPWYRGMNMRAREVLAEAQEDTKHERSIMLHDVGQSMNRCPRSAPLIGHPNVLIAPAILPGSNLWVTMPDPGASESTQLHSRVHTERFLLPEELLLIQGWPVHNSPLELHEHSNNVKASFAGNAFSSSVMLAVFCSLMAAIPWTELSTHDEGSADAEAEAREAAELLKFM